MLRSPSPCGATRLCMTLRSVEICAAITALILDSFVTVDSSLNRFVDYRQTSIDCGDLAFRNQDLDQYATDRRCNLLSRFCRLNLHDRFTSFDFRTHRFQPSDNRAFLDTHSRLW